MPDITPQQLADAHVVTMTRQEARTAIDDGWTEDLVNAMDSAQAEADEPGKTAFVIIEIKGAAL